MPATAPQRKFVPTQFNVANWNELEPLYHTLLSRTILSSSDLEKWLLDLSELSAVVDEYGSRRYIDKSCHTDDPQIQAAYLHFVESIEPKVKPLFFELQKKLVGSPFLSALKGQRYEMLIRQWKADVEIFRPENVDLETRNTKLVNEFDTINAAMTVTFREKEYTPQQAARFLEEPDQPTREEVWALVARRRLQDRTRIESLFDQLVQSRHQIALNAGFNDYRAYTWKALKRFDYTPDDCLRFAEAIAETVVPLVDELDRQRAADLGITKLRPWDQAVDPKNRPPLRPFAESDIDGFVSKTLTIFQRLSPQLADQFDLLRRHNHLDLGSRKGKQPGGYQCSLHEIGEPFIFMNAAGLNGDLRTLLHEGGHAFHLLAVRDEPLMFVRHAPIEFCEVASMTMEFFGMPHLDVFYDPADHARAMRMQFEFSIRFLPWMAIVDLFQHWIYTHPAHTHEQRKAEWLRLLDRFWSKLDWSGFEDVRESLWQRQIHLFNSPFYYVEYGIAQLGALQLWMKTREDPQRALGQYRAALKLGGTRPLPELFAAAGIVFDFSEKTLRPLMSAVGEAISKLSS